MEGRRNMLNVRNEDIEEVIVEIPEGHRHVRTTIRLMNGSEILFQEASMANIVRAFISLKTHPLKKAVRMRGRLLTEKKEGYADWQLLEEEPE